MKGYVIFFFILKLAILIQFALIISNKQTTDSITYITTEVVFKTALFIFIEYIMFQDKDTKKKNMFVTQDQLLGYNSKD